MKSCFVMQPFDNGKFDKRFKEIIEPVVFECGFTPYRVDKDDAADVLIESIEQTISESDFCIAEITTNNPNVWYELGFASAKGKKVIMICSDERGDEPYPFDVRHRNILRYSTKAPSDFDLLKERLKRRIDSSFKSVSEQTLSELEKQLLSFIYNRLNTPYEIVPKEKIKLSDGDDASAALKRLVNCGYLEYIYSVDDNAVQNSYYRVTEIALPLIGT